MSKEQNIQTQIQFGEAIVTGNLEAMRALVSPAVVEHDPGPTQGPGAQGYIDFFTELRSAFFDLSITPEHLTADDDTVALAYTMTGTHTGVFQGIAPTGKSIKARGVQIARFVDGKMVERWGSSDELGILKQLGAAPASKQGILEALGEKLGVR
jgi:steroid delta-isomerase-like uncharacterized protein